MVRWVVGSILQIFPYRESLRHNDWCNKDRDMCYLAYGIVYIKEPLLLISKSRERDVAPW